MMKKYKTVNEWSQKNPMTRNPHRELVHMCVIDDEGFSKDELNALKYENVRVFEKFTDLNDYASYNVILCDIKGVGQNIDPQLDGIAVARDIKKYYPQKIVLQYSGQSVNDYDEKFYENMEIDGFVEKSQSSKQLVDELDKYCSVFWDPVAAWKYIEKNLRKMNIENINIAFFEDLYVRSLEKKKNLIDRNRDNEAIKNIFTIGLAFAELAISIIELVVKH